MPTATAWSPVHRADLYLPQGRQERTRNLAGGAFPGPPGTLTHGPTASPATDGQLRRNAVGTHGVKLDAAPDAPPWGEVLECLPPVPVRTQRRAVAATDIHPPPHRHTRQARTVLGRAGCETARTSPAVWACRGSRRVMSAGRDGVPAGCETARGWRIAQQVARPIGRSVTAGGSDRTCGRHPRPGKDPS
jgi:hypothetical protein